MMRLKFFSIVCLLLVAGVPSLGAEQFDFQAGPIYTSLPPLEDSGKVAIVVELPRGVTPEPSDFRLLIDKKEVATGDTLKPFRQLGKGLAIIVCVDVSGTMKGDPLNETRDAMQSFIGGARPEDKIALITFADQGRTDSPFGKSRDDLLQAVYGLRTRGTLTRLYQTLYDALVEFKGDDIPERRRVIVITDGKDEGSQVSAQNVIDRSRSVDLRIPIDAVGRGKIEDQFIEGLRGLATKTGGRFVHARPDRLSLSDAIDRIYHDLLEIRSLVIYFKYEINASGQTTQNAIIELNLPGEAPLTVRIPDKIPLPHVKIVKKEAPPAPEPKPEAGTDPGPETTRIISAEFWLLLILALLLVIGLCVWFIHRSRNTDEDEEMPPEIIQPKVYDYPPPVSDSSSEVIASRDTGTHEHAAAAPGLTKVGGYYFPVPEPGKPTAVLVGLSGPVEGREYKIEKASFHIGADADNDLVIADDDYVSGEHAYIHYRAGNLSISDDESRNRTFVNDNEVPAGGCALKLGDRIGIGQSKLEVMRASN